MGKGLPVVVLTGLRYVEVDSIDETEAAYTATVDLRLRWQDLRLQYPPESAPQGFLEFRDEAAAAKIAEIWTPVVSLQNLSGEPSQQMRALRIFPDGRVEMMVRTTATFETPFEVERFPFDRQRLQVEVVSRRESVERLSLEFEQDDLDFSQPPDSNELRDWLPGIVSLKRDVVNGCTAGPVSRDRFPGYATVGRRLGRSDFYPAAGFTVHPPFGHLVEQDGGRRVSDRGL